jgi:predicted metalloprotease with PDZ domain
MAGLQYRTMSRCLVLAIVAWSIFLTVPALGLDPSSPLTPIRYTLRFPEPHTHYVDVDAVIPTGHKPRIEIFMAVWTPGSYLVREYAGHIDEVSARAGGKAVLVTKTLKNRWSIQTGGAEVVTVSYKVYGRVMSVRHNWIDSGFAMLNGAPTFVSLFEPGIRRPHEVTIELPQGWTGVQTALPRVAGAAQTFRAEDFDTLVDSPIVAGNPVTHSFVVDGKTHTLVLEGDLSFFDGGQAAADIQKIVGAARELMGSLPYPHYHFLNLVTGDNDGLEHANSFLVRSNRFATRTHKAYLDWLSLVAHEYFHAWNVKRLRPAELGPFDYEHENYVPTLWIAEGFTDYYDDIILRRAGLSTRDECLEALSASIESVQTTPGRLVQPVDQASFDTWIKQYRPDENSVNTTIDYYAKGTAIGFLLDAKIRSLTGGQASLDDVMRLAMARYSGHKGFTTAQFYALASEVAKTDLTHWFTGAVESAGELDYDEAIGYYGLQFHRESDNAPAAKVALGVETVDDHSRIIVSEVRRGHTGMTAGLNVGDEIVAIDDVRVTGDGLAARMEQYHAGDGVGVLVARRGRMIRLGLKLEAAPGHEWKLEVMPGATAEQRSHLAAWIGPAGSPQ